MAYNIETFLTQACKMWLHVSASERTVQPTSYELTNPPKSQVSGLSEWTIIPIINDCSLDTIDNLCLQHLKEKVAAFAFKAMWRPGKELCIPNALSRFRVSNSTSYNDAFNTETSFSVRSIITLQAVESLATTDTTGDSALEELRREG